MTRIFEKKSLDFLNKNKRERDKLKNITWDTNDDNLDNRASDLERLKVVMKTLPEDHRQVLRLFYTEELQGVDFNLVGRKIYKERKN